MAASQLGCLEDVPPGTPVTESSPEFFYSEGQRLAVEALLAGGQAAYAKRLAQDGLRPFLSDEELHSPERAGEGDGDAAELSLSYWPGCSDEPTPELELGWPLGGNWKGFTRAEVFTHPPGDGAPKVKELVRRKIQQAAKVVAIVMDVFTDPDILLDLHEAGMRRGVPVYLILGEQHLAAFLSMAEAVCLNVHSMEVGAGLGVPSPPALCSTAPPCAPLGYWDQPCLPEESAPCCVPHSLQHGSPLRPTGVLGPALPARGERPLLRPPFPAARLPLAPHWGIGTSPACQRRAPPAASPIPCSTAPPCAPLGYWDQPCLPEESAPCCVPHSLQHGSPLRPTGVLGPALPARGERPLLRPPFPAARLPLAPHWGIGTSPACQRRAPPGGEGPAKREKQGVCSGAVIWRCGGRPATLRLGLSALEMRIPLSVALAPAPDFVHLPSPPRTCRSGSLQAALSGAERANENLAALL
nr:proline-rich protein 36 [Pelodiscus sinensis]|eukprot:XP_025034912.1 proline-rich protein 36 [Pelodiscus sinensis]